MLWSANVNFPLSCLSTWHVAQASLLRPCQLWGRISFVQLWRFRKSSTTFRCTLLQSSKDKEDFLCLLTPPQTFTDVKLWTGAEYFLSKNVSAKNLIYSLFNFHFLWNFHFPCNCVTRTPALLPRQGWSINSFNFHFLWNFHFLCNCYKNTSLVAKTRLV